LRVLTKTRVDAPLRSLSYGLAAALCLLAPFLVFLTANNYSALAAEVLPLHLAWLITGLLVASLVMMRLMLLARLALWGCAFVSIAFMYDMPLWAVIAVAALCGTAVGLLGDNAATVLVFAAGLHVLSTIAIGASAFKSDSPSDFQGWIASSRVSPDLPPVLHVVLDEGGGLRGLPDELRGTRPFRSWLVDHYRDQGFGVASHAYSEYMMTTDSLANLFNFTSSAVQGVNLQGADDAYELTSNEYFAQLSRLGYRLHVHQSSYLDFCHSPGAAVISCSTYPDNSIASIAGLRIPTAEKSRFILNCYLDSLAFLRKVRRDYLHIGNKLGIGLPAWPAGNSRVGPLAVLPVVDDLERELRELKPGEFHFAHLMLPHSPYVFNSDCSIKTEVRTWLGTAPFELRDPLGDQNSDKSRAERYVAYMAQVRCTNLIIDRLLVAIRASGQWERAIIIIHGDHGSRIVRRRLTEDNLDRLADDDYRDAYSAFFAARKGGSVGKLDTRPRSLQTLLAGVWDIPVRQPQSQRVYLLARNDVEYRPTPLRGFEPIPGLSQTRVEGAELRERGGIKPTVR
jgi:hypothetical protein